MFALFGDGAFHEEHEWDKQHCQDGGEPEDVEVGERGGLLLAKIIERLQGQLLRSGRVAIDHGS